ncbi:PxORF12 peptide [Plutella xylostella granulovirus]|uniref:ORF12 protein n=1 Tax=Plutella xylostella granulovirus TaxID=98383 RepID=Q9DW18_9BBAC|nr:PxORF12 peptide [Plutella xylostella granulovirus]AAG27310.1 PxORF12 peptide [Plutella xylostella granulovirus]AMQ35624.1 PxGV-Corf12 protein [Plutella xylostella granulovirus]AMQ35741.1 PxGV-Korf12 protein [Plutella xylostella granulovirus]AMQ35858.1 PxGV-Morf12 protein [Plutella xylostella granulovirus]AMQ35975.1 PxGV-Torf12 protein [Plutella xylostella granulovirus]
MDLFQFSTLIFVVLIIIKIIIYHNIKNLQKKTWFMNQLCVKGYYGYVSDPFECDSYYKCPEGLKLYCGQNEQFDADQIGCVAYTGDGCYEAKKRRLLD